MARGILLSWIATDHDPFYSEKERGGRLVEENGVVPGPSLRLITDTLWGPQFHRFVLFHQPEHEEQAVALERAAQTRRPDLAFERRCVGELNPTNHGQILKALSPALTEIVQEYPYKPGVLHHGSPLWDYAFAHLDVEGSDWGSLTHAAASQAPLDVLEADSVWHEEHSHDYFICVSQGTPAMHAIWLVLVQAEIVRATLLQTVPARFQKPGEPCARVVSLDIGKLPMPVVENLKRTSIREHEARKRLGPVARLASFMASNVYGPYEGYGLYLLTHTSSRERVEQCLQSVEEHLQEVREILSPRGVERIEQYVSDGRREFQKGYEEFTQWAMAERGPLKDAFRFSFKEWVATAQSQYRRTLPITCEIAEDARFMFSHPIYCEADVVRRGLDAIAENAATRAYPDDAARPGELLVTFRKRDEALEIRLEDRGVGFSELTTCFQKGPGATGGGLRDVREMAKWFHAVQVESGCRVRYDVREDREDRLISAGTGTSFVILFRPPPTLESQP